MTSKLRKAQITDKVDRCINDLLSEEENKEYGVTVHSVLKVFEQRHPDIIKEHGDDLARQYIARVISGRLRKGVALVQASHSRTLFLPGFDVEILARIPPLITIPPNDDDEESVEIHKPITHATVGEILAYHDLLWDQIRADMESARALSSVCDVIKNQPKDMLLEEAWKSMLAERV